MPVPPNRVSHSPVLSGTVSVSPSLPSDVTAAAAAASASRRLSDDDVDVMTMGTTSGRDETAIGAASVLAAGIGASVSAVAWGSGSVGERCLAMTMPPGRSSLLRVPLASSQSRFFLNRLLSRFFFFFLISLPVLQLSSCISFSRNRRTKLYHDQIKIKMWLFGEINSKNICAKL
jgi:hypothetical protein